LAASSVTSEASCEPPSTICSRVIDGGEPEEAMVGIPDPMMALSPVVGALPDAQLAFVNQSPIVPAIQV
jgi:hypothetical protein